MFDYLFTKAHAHTPLTDIGDFSKSLINKAGSGLPTNLTDLINFAFYVMLTVAVVLAIFGVIRGGYVYLTSADSGSNKSRAKRILQASVGGLLLALGGWLILDTINPQILKFDPKYQKLNNSGTVKLRESVRDPARDAIKNLNNEGIQNGEEEYKKFINGNDYFGYELQELGEKEWAEIIAKSDRDEVRQFLIKIMETNTFTKGSSEMRERRLTDALNYISKSNPDLVAETTALFESRKVAGFYYANEKGDIQLKSVASAPTSSDISQNIGSYSTIFKYNDTQSITALYSAGGGSVNNNSFSSSLVSVLNNKTINPNEINNISTWVDKNGSSIGIKKVEDTYQLSN
jgi:hypothetical protein